MFRLPSRPSRDEVSSELPLFAQKVMVLVGILLALYLAWTAAAVIVLAVVAGIVAAVLAPAVDSLERRRFPSWLAILAVFFILAAFLALAAFAVVPVLVDSVGRLLGQADGWLQSLQDAAAKVSGSTEGRKILKELAKQLSARNVLPFLREHLATLSSGASAALGTGWGVLSATVSAVSSGALAAFLAFVILLERRGAWGVVLSLLPRRTSAYVAGRAPQLAGILKSWLRGQAVVAASVAALVYAGLWVLEAFGISFDSKANLAVVAGMMTFVPYVGVALSLAPALAFALSMGGWAPVVGVAAVYGAAHLAEGNLITPFVIGRVLSVSPLLTFGTMLVLASLLGLSGTVLAAPVSAVVALLYADFVRSRR